MSNPAINQMNEVFRVFSASEGVIRPHFILTGPSGSGKSFNVLQMCEQHNLNFIEVNAAQLTKEGLSGNSLSKALAPLGNFGNRPVVCFIDEFDKLFISGNNNCDLAHESTNGVQNELLKCLESRTTSVFGDYGKYREINVENVLFVFAGAFNGEEDIDIDRLREMGMKTELLGRVGIVFNLERLTLDTLQQLLENSPLLQNYLDIYEADKGKAIETIMTALKESYENNTLGARLINTLLHQYFLNGGSLPEKVSKKASFQRKLQMTPQR
tara:strand:- start:72719 stop:73528 length:810 start_codon:yes stop_codon:yes gene_type:complete